MRSFQAIPDSLCLVGNCFYEKLTLARLLAAGGEDWRTAEVLDLWVWAEGGTPSFVLATLKRGRIAERLGERDRAVTSYRFVSEAWRRADPALEPYVTEAKEGLRRLAADGEDRAMGVTAPATPLPGAARPAPADSAAP